MGKNIVNVIVLTLIGSLLFSMSAFAEPKKKATKKSYNDIQHPNKEEMISKLVGTWGGYTIWYDNQDGKYKQGAEQHCQIVRDAKGIKFIGKDGHILDEDNVYLSYRNGIFYGSYIAGKHGGTHGRLYTVKFTLRFKDGNTLLYQDSTWKEEYQKSRQ
jgi:hypothetical protein